MMGPVWFYGHTFRTLKHNLAIWYIHSLYVFLCGIPLWYSTLENNPYIINENHEINSYWMEKLILLMERSQFSILFCMCKCIFSWFLYHLKGYTKRNFTSNSCFSNFWTMSNQLLALSYIHLIITMLNDFWYRHQYAELLLIQTSTRILFNTPQSTVSKFYFTLVF